MTTFRLFFGNDDAQSLITYNNNNNTFNNTNKNFNHCREAMAKIFSISCASHIFWSNT